MGHRRWLAALAAIAVMAAACSQRAPNQTVASPGPTSTTAAVDDPDRDVLYVQHALFGTTATDETGSTLTLSGVDQVTSWTTADAGGVMTTADFIESWSDLGLDSDNPDAAFISADPARSPVIISLSDPAWDGDRRTITYRVRTVADPVPPLGDMVADPSATLPEVFEVSSLLISQPDAGELPEPATTTTTTTLPPDTVPPATEAPSDSVTPPTPPTPGPSPFPSPQPSPTPPPPSGPAQFTFEPGSFNFPVSGGVRTLLIRNVGSGVGSWTVSPQIGTGITSSPVGGYLFPGSSVTVTLQFNGRGPANDFSTTIELLTSNGLYLLPVVVG